MEPEAAIAAVQAEIDQAGTWLGEALAAGDLQAADEQRARRAQLAEELTRARAAADARSKQWRLFRDLVGGGLPALEGTQK